jgi:hypothetical protein
MGATRSNRRARIVCSRATALQETCTEIEPQIGVDVRSQLHNDEMLHSLNTSKEELERNLNRNLASLNPDISLGQSGSPV